MSATSRIISAALAIWFAAHVFCSCVSIFVRVECEYNKALNFHRAEMRAKVVRLALYHCDCVFAISAEELRLQVAVPGLCYTA